MKRLVLPCLCWTVLTLLAGLIGVWQIHTHHIAGVPAELRAGKLGMGIGALTAAGYAVIWLATTLSARKKSQKEK